MTEVTVKEVGNNHHIVINIDGEDTVLSICKASTKKGVRKQIATYLQNIGEANSIQSSLFCGTTTGSYANIMMKDKRGVYVEKECVLLIGVHKDGDSFREHCWIPRKRFSHIGKYVNVEFNGIPIKYGDKDGIDRIRHVKVVHSE